jgi:hypothetical protein
MLLSAGLDVISIMCSIQFCLHPFFGFLQQVGEGYSNPGSHGKNEAMSLSYNAHIIVHKQTFFPCFPRKCDIVRTCNGSIHNKVNKVYLPPKRGDLVRKCIYSFYRFLPNLQMFCNELKLCMYFQL